MRIRFDRGTLVLEAELPTEDPSQIPGATRDHASAAWRLPAHQYAATIGRLADTGVRISDETRITPIAKRWSFPPLRWYQTAAFDAWQPAKRGVIALPTGAGKTLTAIAAIAHLAVSTLVLVPTRILLDQWARVLAAAWPFPIGRVGDGEQQVAPITVMTYASAISWAPRLGDRFGLVIVDEAHHVGSMCPYEVLEMLVAPHRLGLTATPPSPTASRHLEQLVGPVVYSLKTDDLTGDGLAEYELITVPIQLEPDERAQYREHRALFSAVYSAYQRTSQGLPWADFIRDARQTATGREALASWRTYRNVLSYPRGKQAALRTILGANPQQRSLIFTSDNATTYAIARELFIQPITHEIGRGERAEALERFRAGTVSALVSSQVLDEGLDLPDADLAIVVGGSGSPRRHVQRVGRVLRPRDGKRARVYELAVQESTELSSVSRRRTGLGDSFADAHAAFGGYASRAGELHVFARHGERGAK